MDRIGAVARGVGAGLSGLGRCSSVPRQRLGGGGGLGVVRGRGRGRPGDVLKRSNSVLECSIVLLPLRKVLLQL